MVRCGEGPPAREGHVLLAGRHSDQPARPPPRHGGLVRRCNGIEQCSILGPLAGVEQCRTPQATAAEGIMPRDPMSTRSRHKGGRTSPSPASSTPWSVSPLGSKLVSSGPHDMDILLSSVSRHDPRDWFGRHPEVPPIKMWNRDPLVVGT